MTQLLVFCVLLVLVVRQTAGCNRNGDDEKDNKGKAACGIAKHHMRIDLTEKYDSRVYKISNGYEANRHSWPWIVSLARRDLMNRCGGTLISDQWVLTAAHCVCVAWRDDCLPEDLYVRAGIHKATSEKTETEQRWWVRSVTDIFMHPEYDPAFELYDIALIKLPTKATLNEFVQPICLPSDEFKDLANDDGRRVGTAGWGYLSFKPRGPMQPNEEKNTTNVLQEVVLNIRGMEKCRKDEEYRRRMFDHVEICTLSSDHRDTCHGDSGGPMVVLDNDQYFVVGIVTGGDKVCGAPNKPAIWTNVHGYLDWIKSTMERNE